TKTTTHGRFSRAAKGQARWPVGIARLRSSRRGGRGYDEPCAASAHDPPMDNKLLAFDLGAESGRGVLGRFDGRRLQLDVAHRFANGGVRTLQTLHWDVLRLYGEIVTGLRRCATDFGGVDSVGVDTWGVDFGLLGRDDTLLGNPRHYRDPHTETILEEAFARS